MSSRRRSDVSALGALTGGTQPASNHFSNMLSQIETIDQSMAQRAVVHEDGAIQLDSFRITPIGLVGGETATEVEWRKLGRLLFQLHDSLQIILGDWLVQGERVYGKTYEDLAIEFDRKKKTLYNWKYVMSSVDISLRRENLSYKHYMIVAPMTYENQARWLGLASANSWGAGKMQDEIYKEIPAELPPAPKLRYSDAVKDAREMFNKRSERINRALDGKDDLDEETVWACIVDIEKFTRAIRENFGWID